MFDRIKNYFKFNKNKKIVNSNSIDDFFEDLVGGKKTVNAMDEPTYFICMKILGETIGKLPIKAYKKTAKGGRISVDNDILKVISVRPNVYTTASAFWSDVERRRNHYGNAYIYLKFSKKGENKGRLEAMYILDNDKVDIVIDDKKIFSDIPNKLFYRLNGNILLSYEEILHFRTSFSEDGITGIPVREQLKNIISSSYASAEFFEDLNENGLTGKVALNYSADLDTKMVEKMMKSTKEFLERKSGALNIIPVPPSMELRPLNINLNDAQFLENRKYLSQQLASCFGIKPYFLNEYSNGGSSNFEFQNTSFYIDTLMYILKHYEEELNYKLMLDDDIKLKFNEKAILRLSAKDQIEFLRESVNNAIMMPNEAREQLQLDSAEGGDILICNGNYIPVTDVGKQYGLEKNNGKEVGDENTEQKDGDRE